MQPRDETPNPDGLEPPSGIMWTDQQRKELIELYIQRMDLRAAAEHFGTNTRDVVRELSLLILGGGTPSEDKTAKRYGTRWDWRDDQILIEQYQLGASIDQVADVLGRDEMAVAFRILERYYPRIPAATLAALGLDGLAAQKRIDEQPLVADGTSLCALCGDVVLYCKCGIANDNESF